MQQYVLPIISICILFILVDAFLKAVEILFDYIAKCYARNEKEYNFAFKGLFAVFYLTLLIIFFANFDKFVMKYF